MVLALVPCTAGSGGDQRVRLIAGDQAPVLVDNAERYAHMLDADPEIKPMGEKQPPPCLTGEPRPPPVTATFDHTAARVTGGQVEDLRQTPARLEDLIELPQDPPSAEFRARLADVYGVTDEPTILSIWSFFLKEPASYGLDTKTGNSVVRYVLATGRELGSARPSGLKPDATRATVRATGGLALRQAPWEASIGNVPQGAAVSISPPPVGSWYRVETPNGSGWVSGIYLEFQ